MSLPNAFAVRMIDAYSLFTESREHVCNMVPSCSMYGRMAYERYGFFRATHKLLARLRECGNPYTDWPRENYPRRRGRAPMRDVFGRAGHGGPMR
ncbi:MAG: membrane protein insertion efficiency factor YidD [Candidatus Methanoplasma sp.]|nr:membrane protein insertion efficiency factor YidD [Candidatus Methanoplasma sp.]